MNPASRPLPSPIKHAIAALGVLGLAAVGGLALLQTEPPEPAIGTLALPERAVPPSADSLLGDPDQGALPDLLAGVVEEGRNPTENYVDPAPPPRTGSEPTPRVVEVIARSRPDPLPRAPIDDLQTRSSYGFVPMIAENGRTPFEAYRRPAPSVSGPTYAVLVGGLGINPEMTRRAIEELPPEITLGFAAHAPNLQSQIDRAREYGHEVVLELPMESANSDPSEPLADRQLRTGASTANVQNLDYLLSRAGGYFAVVPYGGDVFLARGDAAAPIFEKLADAGLGFVSDPQLDVPTLSATSRTAGLRYRDGTMLIDENPDPSAIRDDLATLLARAKTGERPVGFGFAYPATIDALIAFDSSGATLVPLSASF